MKIAFVLIEVRKNEDSISGVASFYRIRGSAERDQVCFLQSVLFRALDCGNRVSDLHRICRCEAGLKNYSLTVWPCVIDII